MKLQGITGTGTGKLGSSIFAVSAGQQIVRQYQPNVTNPSTLAQVNNRAKMKLLAQLATAVSESIAISKDGLVSARNQFISKNYPFAVADNGVADINLIEMQLTKGTVTLPAVTASRSVNNTIEVALSGTAAAAVNRVIYVAYQRNYDGTLSLLDSAIVSAPGLDGTFPDEIAGSSADVFVYAYGMIDTNATASAKYSDYHVETGQDLARLIAQRTISEEDYIFTKTTGTMIMRDTSVDFSAVSVGGTAIAASGSTNVAYSTGKLVQVTTIDANGLYVRLLGAPTGAVIEQINNNSAQIQLTQLAGGEEISFQIGEYNEGNFTPYRTYGGKAVIAAQNTQFTSVDVNGVTIGSSGTTQVGEAATSEIIVTASNNNNIYMRVLINGTAQGPAAYVQNRYRALIPGLQVGDVLTFQLGRMSGTEFIPTVTFGGSATIAVNPPAFTSLTVNGNTIAASGSTNVVEGNSLPIVVNTSNADGKVVGFSTNGVDYTILNEIVSGVATENLNLSAGQTLHFCIGHFGSGPQVVPEVIFGGTVNVIAQPQEGITEVTIASVPLTSNLQDQVSGTKALAIAVTGIDTTNKRACAYAGDVAIGSSFTLTSGNAMTFNNDVASMSSFFFDTSKNYYFYVGTYEGNTFTVTHKFQYYYNTAGSDES